MKSRASRAWTALNSSRESYTIRAIQYFWSKNKRKRKKKKGKRLKKVKFGGREILNPLSLRALSLSLSVCCVFVYMFLVCSLSSPCFFSTLSPLCVSSRLSLLSLSFSLFPISVCFPSVCFLSTGFLGFQFQQVWNNTTNLGLLVSEFMNCYRGCDFLKVAILHWLMNLDASMIFDHNMTVMEMEMEVTHPLLEAFWSLHVLVLVPWISLRIWDRSNPSPNKMAQSIRLIS